MKPIFVVKIKAHLFELPLFLVNSFYQFEERDDYIRFKKYLYDHNVHVFSCWTEEARFEGSVRYMTFDKAVEIFKREFCSDKEDRLVPCSLSIESTSSSKTKGKENITS